MSGKGDKKRSTLIEVSWSEIVSTGTELNWCGCVWWSAPPFSLHIWNLLSFSRNVSATCPTEDKQAALERIFVLFSKVTLKFLTMIKVAKPVTQHTYDVRYSANFTTNFANCIPMKWNPRVQTHTKFWEEVKIMDLWCWQRLHKIARSYSDCMPFSNATVSYVKYSYMYSGACEMDFLTLVDSQDFSWASS